MRRVDLAELLAHSPLFAALPARVRDGLAARASRRRARAGQRVLARHDPVVIVVVTGRLEVVADRGDEVAVVRSLVPPAVTGLSVAVDPPASAELWAAEASELIAVPADAVLAALRRYPEAALAAIAQLGGVVAELSAEVAALHRHRGRRGVVKRRR